MGEQPVGMTVEGVLVAYLIAVFSKLDDSVASFPVVHDELSGFVLGEEVNRTGDAVLFVADAPLGAVGDGFLVVDETVEGVKLAADADVFFGVYIGAVIGKVAYIAAGLA